MVLSSVLSNEATEESHHMMHAMITMIFAAAIASEALFLMMISAGKVRASRSVVRSRR